jgi:hypothetical protein
MLFINPNGRDSEILPGQKMALEKIQEPSRRGTQCPTWRWANQQGQCSAIWGLCLFPIFNGTFMLTFF